MIVDFIWPTALKAAVNQYQTRPDFNANFLRYLKKQPRNRLIITAVLTILRGRRNA